jgi:branched-chain amino acid transport system ATP-binding protein
MSNEVLLHAKSLRAWYGAAQILYDVDLEVRRGEVVALMGRNGAGKSTTLKTLMGMLDKRSGSMQFLGKDISKSRAARSREAWAWAMCPKTGVSLQT